MTASDPHPVVVVGFDGSPASHVALSRAIQRVGPYGKLYVVHAWVVPESWRGRGNYQPYVDRALTEAEAVMQSAVEAHPGLKGPGCDLGRVDPSHRASVRGCDRGTGAGRRPSHRPGGTSTGRPPWTSPGCRGSSRDGRAGDPRSGRRWP